MSWFYEMAGLASQSGDGAAAAAASGMLAKHYVHEK